jgi:ribosomal protein S4E
MDYSSVSVGNNLTAGSTTAVYKVPTGYAAKWNLMYLHNASGNTKFITAKWYDASTTTEYIVLDQYTMASKEYLKFDGGAYVVLDEGDEIRLTAEASSTFSSINTFELVRKK